MGETARAPITTILFTDLVDSTALMQRVGDERAQRLFETHHQLLSDAVSGHGGNELQWLGDGLMVAFASTADAVRCAVAMQQTAAQRPVAERLRIRVGLNVGEVMRQEIGSGSGYFGTPVVTARRLCDRAEAGQILCSQALSHLLAGRAAFTFRECEALEMKGVAEKIGVCEVVYETEPAAAVLVQTPFVGRHEEIARLKAWLEQARAGRGSLVMLVGEPGIGKTRTLEEFSAHARQHGARVLWGRCYEGEGAPAFGPFAEAVAEYAKELSREELAKDLGPYGPPLSVLSPVLRSRLPDLPAPVPLQPDEERWRLLDALAQLLLTASQRAPIVLVLDDLHWADAGTVAMLRYIARFASRGRLFLLGAYRDVELGRQHALANALGALRREVEYERIVLRGLGEGEVSELLQAIASQEVPEALVHALHAETDGNPFFLREVLLHLVEERKLYRDEGRWTTDYSVEELGIPEGVREVIGRRLSRLSKETNRLLSAASGCAGAFHLGVAAEVAGLDERMALDALDEALEAQLLRATGNPEIYDFTHALIRHTLYGELSPARQVRLHRRLAEEMERVYSDRVEHAGEIARQWHRSSAIAGAERGVPHCLAAADAAENRAAHEDAAAALRMALDLLLASDARRPRLLARLGLALALSREVDQTLTVGSEAGELLAASEGDDAAADYLAEVTEALWLAAQTPRAWELSTQGLRHIGGRRDLTWVKLTDFELQRGSALDPENPGMPVDSPEVRELSRIVKGFGRLPSEAMYFYLAFESRREVLELAPMSPLRVAFQAGEYQQALDLYRSAAKVALERGELAMAAMALGTGARVHLALGDLAAADDWYAQGLRLAERVGNQPFVAVQLLGHPFERATMQGEGFEQLLALRETGHADALENRWVMAPVWAGSAYVSAALGNSSAALAYLSRVERAIDLAPGWTVNYLFLIHWSAYAVWELNLTQYAPFLERNLREKPLAGDFRYPSTDARLALAWMCALQGRYDEASQWFERARKILDQQAARPLRAIVDFEEARTYARRAAPGDRDRAGPLLDAACGSFESIGMPGWLRRADELRQQLGR